MNAIGTSPARRPAGTLPHVRAIGAWTQATGIAAGRALGSHPRGVAANSRIQRRGTSGGRHGMARARAGAHGIDRVHRRIRIIALAADRTGLAAWRSLRRPCATARWSTASCPRSQAAARCPHRGWRAPRPALSRSHRPGGGGTPAPSALRHGTQRMARDRGRGRDCRCDRRLVPRAVRSAGFARCAPPA